MGPIKRCGDRIVSYLDQKSGVNQMVSLIELPLSVVNVDLDRIASDHFRGVDSEPHSFLNREQAAPREISC